MKKRVCCSTLVIGLFAFVACSAQEANAEKAEQKTSSAIVPSPDAINGVEQASNAQMLEQAIMPDQLPPEPVLSLLGQEVQRNESAILSWQLESSLDLVSAPVSVLVVNGKEPGPILCLTAAVHGDELNGIEIVRRIVHETKAEKLKGTIIAVPIVNLEGFKRATRYLPDRRDLNRYFPGRASGSYASRIAFSFFESIVRKCSYLVDIHTGSLDRTNLPQLRADLNNPEVADLAEKMGSIVVLQSRGGLGTLRRAASDAGIPAVTIEAGAPNNLQKDAVEKGVASIKSALRSLGLVESKRWERSKEPIYFRSRWIRAKNGGILFSRVELGDKVKPGTVLGLISNPITNKTTRIKSTMEGRVIGMSLNRIMHPGFAAYHIGLKSSAVEAAQPDEPASEPLAEDELEQDNASIISPAPTPQIDTPAESDASAAEPSPTIDVAPIEEMELPTAEDSD